MGRFSRFLPFNGQFQINAIKSMEISVQRINLLDLIAFIWNWPLKGKKREKRQEIRSNPLDISSIKCHSSKQSQTTPTAATATTAATTIRGNNHLAWLRRSGLRPLRANPSAGGGRWRRQR